MKKFGRNCLKLGLLISLIVSSTTTIIINLTGNNFDPIKKIQRLKYQNRRGDALDLAKFYRDNQTGDSEKFATLEKDLAYTRSEKLKSFFWYGAIKGQIYDTYSGLGAISTDLCIAGDIRDLGIQSWKYLTGAHDIDKSITLLSAAGICLSAAPHIDGVNALIKTTLKYLKRVHADMNKGLLRKFLTGKISPQHHRRLWDLLKKTNGPFLEPQPVYHKFTALNI